MKVVVKFNFLEDSSKYISIDENKVLIMENNEEQVIETTREDRLLALFNLFSFKDTWKKEDVDNALYEVLFDDGSEHIYSFSDIPDNWPVFMGYMLKLVGDAI